MIRIPGLVVSVLTLLLPLGCASGSASVSTSTAANDSTENAEPEDRAPTTNSDDGAPGGVAKDGLAPSGSGDASAEDVPPEPPWAASVRETLRGAEATENPLGLALVVSQSGADLPWTLLVANPTERAVRLVADVRLLELEVQKPSPPQTTPTAKVQTPKLEKCQLPESERPKSADDELTVELAAGAMAVYRFDPRLVCDESLLVPGAVVTPRFGWAPKTKTVWKGGKKEEVLLPQQEPFVAKLEVQGSAEGPEPLKQLTGPSFSLDDSYAEPPEQDDATTDEGPPPFRIAVRPLGSANDVRNETVTVEIKNPASVGRYLFVRRELITYEIVGPAGSSTCSVYPDQRAPARQSFEYFGPGRTLNLVSRLPEMCPPGTFDTTGIYRVHARLDATERGDDYKLNAFVGVVASKKPGILRMRGGTPPRMQVLPIRASSR